MKNAELQKSGSVWWWKIVEMEPWWCKFETPLKNGRHEACFRARARVCMYACVRVVRDHEEYEGTEDEQGDRKMVARKEARA